MKETPVAPRTQSAQKNEIPIAVAHGFAGWALCAAAMGTAMHLTTHDRALLIHAAAAPLIFAAVSFLYFRRRSSLSPLYAAIVFLSTVAALDFFVVALIVVRDVTMFTSILGVWLPFLLIFLASWLTGQALKPARFRSTSNGG